MHGSPPPDRRAARSPRVSVCIATYRREDRLDRLLEDLRQQRCRPDEVIVVDNDASGSARAVVERHRERPQAFALYYDIQPQKNIALTRNRSVELADGDWIAFIDDDERAPERWLEQLLDSAREHRADAVLGPVVPLLPPEAPPWIRRGHFYDWARMPSGTRIPPNRLRFGNVLIRAHWLTGTEGLQFDPAYGLTGGEDGDLLSRLALRGARIVWCDEAEVIEPVEPARLSLRWLLRRALRGGQDFARHALAGRYGPLGPVRRLLLFLRAALQVLVAALLALLLLPLGWHHAVRWLTRVSANLGKLSVLWGAHYREYA